MWGQVTAAVESSTTIAEWKIQSRQKKIAFMKETLSPEEFKQWEISETEERRHRELCQAIRDSKPDRSYSDSSSGLFGFALGATLFDGD